MYWTSLDKLAVRNLHNITVADVAIDLAVVSTTTINRPVVEMTADDHDVARVRIIDHPQPPFAYDFVP